MQLTPFVRRLYIQTTDAGEIAPLTPNWAQREYLHALETSLTDKGRARLIVLKARQLGLSTITEACMFAMCFMYERYRGLVVSHEQESAQHLLSMTQTFWDTFFAKDLYSTKYEARNMLAWTESMSQLRIATAKNTGAGRSRTIDFLHASEVAFWLKAGALMTGLSKSIHETPGTVIVLESTAKGRGNYFHQMWEAAVSGDNDYTPLFFPWHLHPEYTGSHLAVPLTLGKLSEEERVLKRMHVDDDHLVWRRYAWRNLCAHDWIQFMQEYPSTPEEAFISTGHNVFPADGLKTHYAPSDGHRGKLVRQGETSVKFVADPAGPLTLFADPSPSRDWGQYIIGGDPSRVIHGDWAVAQVLNRRTMEQVAVWRGKTEPVRFASEMIKLGLYYNEALLCPEKQGSGQTTIGKLLALNYPNIVQQGAPDRMPGAQAHQQQYGWDTNVRSKHEAIGWLLEHFSQTVYRDAAGKYTNGLLIHDRATYSELCNYVSLDGGGYGNGAAENHDDTVMALAIAVTCHEKEPPLVAYRAPSAPAAAAAQSVRIRPKAPGSSARVTDEIPDEVPDDEYAESLDNVPHFMRNRG